MLVNELPSVTLRKPQPALLGKESWAAEMHSPLSHLSLTTSSTEPLFHGHSCCHKMGDSILLLAEELLQSCLHDSAKFFSHFNS